MRELVVSLLAIFTISLLGCEVIEGDDEKSDIRITGLIVEEVENASGATDTIDFVVYMVAKNFGSEPGEIMMWHVVSLPDWTGYKRPTEETPSGTVLSGSVLPGEERKLKLNHLSFQDSTEIAIYQGMLQGWGLLIEMLVRESDGETYYHVYYEHKEWPLLLFTE